MSTIGIAESDIETFERDGVVCLRGAFDAEWMARIERGIESELATPGPRFLDQQDAGQPGRFVTAYCTSQHIPEFQSFALESPAGGIVASLLRSRSAGFLMDVLWIKEPGTEKRTAVAPFSQVARHTHVSEQCRLRFDAVLLAIPLVLATVSLQDLQSYPVRVVLAGWVVRLSSRSPSSWILALPGLIPSRPCVIELLLVNSAPSMVRVDSKRHFLKGSENDLVIGVPIAIDHQIVRNSQRPKQGHQRAFCAQDL